MIYVMYRLIFYMKLSTNLADIFSPIDFNTLYVMRLLRKRLCKLELTLGTTWKLDYGTNGI